VPVVLVLSSTPALADEIDDLDTGISVSGVVSCVAQCGEQGCFGALPFQPEVSLRLDRSHEFLFKIGVAFGDAQNPVSPFNIAPWAADLEADVENVNGRSRDHLLTAWYRYSATLADESTLEFSLGIIDATDYLDDNAYSNDEYTQFMNSALVNGPNVFLPSYDRGLALSWSGSHWSARAVYMNVGQNDDGNAFNFLGAQLGYRADTPWGEGNYRLLVDATDRQFQDPTGTSLERRSAVLVSCDQELGRGVGAFIRVGWQTDEAAIDYGSICSGGIDLGGRAWGRERDGIGLGYAYLGDGNGELLRSQVLESYYRLAVNRVFSVTGDVQYMRDDRVTEESPAGFILGLRFSAEF